MPRVSIIVPVYNAENFIQATVSMVQAQTYEDWELILVEDGSTDDTRLILEDLIENTLDRRIRVIFFDGNEHGAAGARNRGVEEATGEIIAFLDADDVWKRSKLERELKFMQEKDAGFVFMAYEFGDENAVGTGKIVHVPKSLDYRHALSRTVIFTSTVMIDTSKIDKSLAMMPLVPSEDTACWWNILRQGNVAYGYDDEVLVTYRRPAVSLSSNKGKAITRIWNLYRNVEHLNIFSSAIYFIGWAIRATLRRI